MIAPLSVRDRAGRYLGDAVRGARRAPVEVLVTLWAAITFSWALETGDEAMEVWPEVAVPCVLILVVAWTGTLLHAMGAWSPARRWALTLGGSAVVWIWATTVLDLQLEAEAWRAAMLVGAGACWMVALPAFGGPTADPVGRMRRVDGRVVLRTVGAGLYGAALFAGLALALAAVDSLFELNLDDEIYGHVWGWIFLALVPWIVLGGLPEYVRPVERGSEIAAVARRIAVYLVPPLLAVYYLILYAYAARILVTGEVPRNLVSPLVLAAGGLAALALLLFDPREGPGGLARGLRLAAPLFLPLVPLGAWALLVRVDQYGWTEFRALRIGLLVALAGLAAGATLQVVRRRPLALQAAPLAVGVVLLVGAVGPWSVLSLSRESQRARLEVALVRVGVAPDVERPRPAAEDDGGEARTVPAEAYEQVRDGARYLAGHFGPEALPPALRGFARTTDSRWRDYAEDLGIRPDAALDGAERGITASVPYAVPVEVDGGTARRFDWTPSGRPERSRGRGAGGGLLRVTMGDSARLVVRTGERVLEADLRPLLDLLRRRAAEGRTQSDLTGSEAVLPVTDTAGVERGQLVLWQVRVDPGAEGTGIRRLEGLVVERPE